MITVENGDQDLSAIFKTNLRTGDRRLLYKHDTVDIGSVLTDEEGSVFGATVMDGYLSRVFFKAENKEKDRIKKIISLFPGSMIRVLSLSDDENKITFTVSSDINPGIHYLLDLNSGDIMPVGKYWGSIDDSKLSYMEPISFNAQDGCLLYTSPSPRD